MDSAFAFVAKDCVVFVADSTSKHSILVLKEHDDKIRELFPSQALVVTGEPGDVVHFTEFVSRNLKLQSLRQGHPLSIKATANFIRGEIASAIRKHPMNVFSLFGGVDADGPSMYFMDYIGTMGNDNFGVIGYAQYFLLSTYDRYWKDNMDRDAAMKFIYNCVNVMGRRFLLKSRQFIAKFVYADHTETVTIDYTPPDIDPTPEECATRAVPVK